VVWAGDARQLVSWARPSVLAAFCQRILIFLYFGFLDI
jgi:hypothetical protein